MFDHDAWSPCVLLSCDTCPGRHASRQTSEAALMPAGHDGGDAAEPAAHAVLGVVALCCSHHLEEHRLDQIVDVTGSDARPAEIATHQRFVALEQLSQSLQVAPTHGSDQSAIEG